MKNTVARMVVSALVFLLFTWASTLYYMTFIHDVGGTYWAMGAFGMPVVLFSIWCVDSYLKRRSYFQSRYGALTAIDWLLTVVFYYPGFMFVWGVIYVLGIA